MLVNNFQRLQSKTHTTFTADFTFRRHFDPSVTKRYFYKQRLGLALRHPLQFSQQGFKTKHTIWFTIPNDVAITSGYEEAFFLSAVSFAQHLNEDLRFEAPVSSEILKKTEKIKAYFRLTSKVNVTTLPGKVRKTPIEKVGLFFTLGVDSFYSLLVDKNPKDYLIFVDGFDVPLKETLFLQNLHRRITEVGETTRKEPIFVQSNLREVSDQITNWGRFHVTALATIGLLLPFQTTYISGESFDWPDWGLRYGVDKLFSTSKHRFEFIEHDSRRDLKIMALKKVKHFEVFLKHVRVCWKNAQTEHLPYNCSECQKCLRTQLTMLALDITDTPTFNSIDPKKLARVDLVDHLRTEWTTLYKMLKNKPGIDPKIIKAVEIILEKPLRF